MCCAKSFLLVLAKNVDPFIRPMANDAEFLVSLDSEIGVGVPKLKPDSPSLFVDEGFAVEIAVPSLALEINPKTLIGTDLRHLTNGETVGIVLGNDWFDEHEALGAPYLSQSFFL